ncbi:MAG: enoyl-CoA hydratase-related protein, partial [Actinomycetota bacterium]
MTVKVERREAVVVVTIDRPQAQNAVDAATAQALEDAIRAFDADEGLRALVLTGAGGRSFCAGADLKALDLLSREGAAASGPLGISRLEVSKPTIAAIGGYCYAG